MVFLTINFLRGLASLSVMLFHFNIALNLSPEIPLLKWMEKGWMGVYLFFIISGFVVPWSLWQANYEQNYYWKFMTKRIIRLEPPYIASVLLIVFLNNIRWFVGGNLEIDIPRILLHIGYLNIFCPKTWLSPVYWSLAIEFQYYLAIGLIYSLIISNKGKVRLFLNAIFYVFYLSFFQYKHFIFQYIPFFLMGVATFQYKVKKINRVEAVIILLASLFLAYRVDVILPTLSLVVVLMILKDPLKFRSLSLLGDLSYSLYLIHIPIGLRVINLFRSFEYCAINKLIILILSSVICVFSAMLFRICVEKPFLRMSKKIAY